MTARNRRGLTLIELLFSLTIIAVIAGVSLQAYLFSVESQGRFDDRRVRIEESRRLEDRLRDLLSRAYVGPSGEDSYFISSQNSGGTAGIAPGALTFTVAGRRLSSAYLRSQDDFETLNETFGPQGGLTEVTLATSPTGQGASGEGLFLRTQTPSDGDPTQGGFESLMDGEVENAEFEFFDGVNWVSEWDTEQTDRRLPAAVRVTLTLRGTDETKVFVVRLPLSDARPEDPVTFGALGGVAP